MPVTATATEGAPNATNIQRTQTTPSVQSHIVSTGSSQTSPHLQRAVVSTHAIQQAHALPTAQAITPATVSAQRQPIPTAPVNNVPPVMVQRVAQSPAVSAETGAPQSTDHAEPTSTTVQRTGAGKPLPSTPMPTTGATTGATIGTQQPSDSPEIVQRAIQLAEASTSQASPTLVPAMGIQRAGFDHNPAPGADTGLDARLSAIMRTHEEKQAKEGTEYMQASATKPAWMSDDEYSEELQRQAKQKDTEEGLRWSSMSTAERSAEIQRKGIKRRKSGLHVSSRPSKKSKAQRKRPTAPKPTKANDIDSAIAKAESSVTADSAPEEHVSAQVVQPTRKDWADSAKIDPSSNLQRLVADVPSGKESDSSIDFVAPTRPRPKRQKPVQRKDVQVSESNSAEKQSTEAPASVENPTQVETEIGSLPSDLWEILDQPAPQVQRQSTSQSNKAAVSKPSNGKPTQISRKPSQKTPTVEPSVQRSEGQTKKKT